MKPLFFLLIIVSLTNALTSCKKSDDDEEEQVIVIKSSGAIETDIETFRGLIGDPSNTAPGASGGRREVNWEGVPDELINAQLPLDFFNPTGASAQPARQRGLAYASSGGQFQVSNNNFAGLNAQASQQFAAFSGTKVFANINSNLWEVGFQVPGQNIEASVKGFGAVFSDVDSENSTALEFFNGTQSLGKFFVPAHNGTSSFSFLGVVFNNEQVVTRVQVSHSGNLSDGSKDLSDDGQSDLVVLDDFFYSEPVVR